MPVEFLYDASHQRSRFAARLLGSPAKIEHDDLSLPENSKLIDTRENDEWAAGHAAGAVHLGKGIIERDIEAQVPAKDTKLVLYCGGGYRSALAADALRQMGYSDAISLDGGWRAYQASGLPLEK